MNRLINIMLPSHVIFQYAFIFKGRITNITISLFHIAVNIFHMSSQRTAVMEIFVTDTALIPT